MKESIKPIIQRYLAEFVYGAVDGTVTTFAVVAASAGAGLSSVIILVLGVANLIADGFSMGASAYLSEQAEMHEASSRTKKASPRIIGFATFAAFVAVGALPITPYMADAIFSLDLGLDVLFMYSIGITAVTFLVIGYVKGRINDALSVTRSMAETLLLGVIAAALAYFAGDVLASWLGASL